MVVSFHSFVLATFLHFFKNPLFLTQLLRVAALCTWVAVPTQVPTTPKQELRAVGADPAERAPGRAHSPWRARKLEGQRAGGEAKTGGSEMARSRPQSKPVINLGTRATSSGPLLQQNKSAVSHLPPVLCCYFPTITLLPFCKLQGILTEGGGVYFSRQKNLLLTPWMVRENRAHTWTQNKESELLHAPGETQPPKYSISGIDSLVAQFDFFLCGSNFFFYWFLILRNYLLVGFALC